MDCVEAVPMGTAINIKADHDERISNSPIPALPSAPSVVNPRTRPEVDFSRIVPTPEVSKSPPEEFHTPLSGSELPSPTQSPKPDASTTGMTSPKSVVGVNRPPPTSQETTDSPFGTELLSVLQPPQLGSGKPAYIKRGPGRPRKDGAGPAKIPKQVLGKKFKNGIYTPGASRGVRGRKKADGTYMVGGTNGGISAVGELGLLNHESPPRITEDAAESDTSSVASSMEKLQEDFSLFPEQWPGKVCSFCNLGERSMMGQGELLRLEIPACFDPYSVFKGLAIMCKSEKDSSSERSPKTNFSSRRQKGIGKIKRLTSQGSLESMNEPVDEVVGYVEEPELSSIFDTSSGCYYAHYSCSLWCTGVQTNSDDSFVNLEKEIVRSMGQRCGHCSNLGAGLLCKAPKCMIFLHFPCAATSGAFQEPSAHKTICAAHIDMAVALMGKAANCTVCDTPGNLSSLLMCNSCGHHYHSSCMALNPDPAIRAGWQCPACKMCQACRQPGDENKLLSCDTCDKSYHIFCLRPALSSIPKHSWKCKMCRICTDCGARTPGSGPSSRWHANFSVCDSCYQQRNKGLACPLCGKAYRHVAQKLMLQCHLCRKYVHGVCDPAADLTTYQQRKELYPDYEYICIPCKAAGTGLNTSGGNPRVLSTLKKDGTTSETSICNASQDSLLSHEDDSLHGMENINDLNAADKAITAVQEEVRPPMPIPRERQGSVGYQRKKLGVGRPKNADRGLPPSSTHNRRHRITELVRKRGPKPKIRGVFGVPGVGLQRPSNDCSQKGDDEPGVENRLVLCSARDDFVLQQDVCVMCGAFGSDLEGRLISCAQCGQCYHPYCVNIKVTKVVLQKGWRCLDCTVCEGCGQRNDESRLILCDDCDISFHIYCIDPPLEYVPQGNWKCKWCAICHMCGSNDPGYKSTWHNNYTICGPCASLQTCHICNVNYHEGELVVQCQRCERWLHGACDMISDEVDAETCVSDDYNCVQCRPADVLPPHLQPPPPPVVVKIEIPLKSPEPIKPKPPAQFLLDGICLSESGIRHIKSLTLEQPRKKRKKVYTSADMEAGILAAIESVVSGGDARLDGKAVDDSNEKDKGSNKRQRNLQKLGIGGFLVRLRGPRFKEEDGDAAENHGVTTEMDKPKRKAPRKKIKNKVVESFPSYLQEAFFGKPLLEPNKDGDLYSDEEVEVNIASNLNAASTVKLSKDELKAIEAVKAKQEQIERSKPGSAKSTPPNFLLEDALLLNEAKTTLRKSPIKVEEDEGDEALQNILADDLLDNDLSLVDTIMNEEDDMKVEDSLDDLANSTLGDGVLNIEGNGGNHKDELSDFLTAQFNLESSLPSMDIKDVEDIFKGVLTDESQESQDNIFPITNAPPSSQQIPIPTGVTTSTVSTTSTPSIIPQNINPAATLTTTVQGSPGLPRGSQLQQNVQQGLASPISFPPPSPYHSEYSNSPQFSPAFSEPPSPWPAQADAETDQPSSYNQRSILKWEADEALGQNATISAVLYANMNHPELKRDFQGWGERSKQIAKIWRGLSAEKRAPYLQKARENRAASRMQKSQQDQDKMITGAPVKPNRVETPEERQWKQMQAMRQQQAQQQQIQDQRLQGDAAKDPISANTNLAPSPKLQYSPSMVQVQRQLSNEMSHMTPPLDITRQPLQVTTSNDSNMPGPQSSPHLQSPNSRQTFATSLPPSRLRPQTLEMPPPSPSHYSSRPGSIPPPQSPVSPAGRAPLYSRIPYMHSPRQQMQQSPGDPYSSSPLTPQSDPYAHPPSTPRPSTESDNFSSPEPFQQQKIMSEQYIQNAGPNSAGSEMDGSTSPRAPVPPQAQETRQHLRDLLQRQQIKKMEEQMSPHGSDILQHHPQTQQNAQRPTSWQQDDWQKGGPIEQMCGQNFGQRHQLNSPTSPQMGQQNQFRQPFLPVHVRISLPSGQGPQQLQPLNRPPITDFRGTLQSPQQQPLVPQQSLDAARMRLMLQQQQQRVLLPPSQTNLPRSPNFAIQQPGTQQPTQFRQSVPSRNPLDPYDHLVAQQDRVVSDTNNVPVSGASMLSRQLARPLNTGVGVGGSHSVPNSPSPQAPHSNNTPPAQPIMPPSGVSNVGAPHHAVLSQSDHQELPDSVTAELEKLEQEQHNDGEVEAGELVDLGVDDDELLGMGADFNILEYADPELEQAVGGEKTNILDNLDLEEEKEDEKDDKELKRKDDIEKSDKKDNDAVQQFSNVPPGPQPPPVVVPKIESAGKPNPSILPASKPSYMQHQPTNTVDVAGPLLRPPQPPPPYPGPPPPYPGRPQMGIRNNGGGGMCMPMPLMSLGLGMKHSQLGMESTVLRPPPHMPSSPLSSSNNLMSLHQRRPLLLQEQPLLLEDLLEQEKREQQRQGPGPNLMGAAPEEPLLSDFDFERLKLDVLNSNTLPVSLSPPNVAGQGILPPPSQSSIFSRNMAAPITSPQVNSQWQVEPDQVNVGVMSNRQNIGPTTDSNTIPLHPALAQNAGSNVNAARANPPRVPNFQLNSIPTPPTPPENPATEQERQMQIQYEQWLFHQQHVLSMQLKFYETEVSKLRKGKKSLNSKQRQLKKNGGELNENDQMELERISRDLTGLQKQLEQARKQSRQHSILTTDYRTKQQKRQQMMGMSPGGGPPTPSQVPLPTQASPLGAPSHSPLHSTPQSPMMSPSPMGGPASSPLMQHSPMASPLTPSPGPGPNSLSQTSPRTMTNMHHMDDRPFSPNTDGPMRSMTSPQNGPTGNRMQVQQQGGVRMGTPISNSQQLVMSPGGNMGMNVNPNSGMMIPRGVNVVQMHQQRPMGFMDSQGGMQRIRSIGPPPEQMNRMIGPMAPRFQRVATNQEMIMRGRMPHQNFQNQNPSQMVMSPGGQHYGNAVRVPFPNQSPTGSNMNMGMVSNLRSPSPMSSMGGMGSPPGSQVMLVQNRVSPASSPMRRPSGSGSVGVPSPMPDRPQSVENPLTPRSTGSGPHTPSGVSGSSLNCHNVEGIAPTPIGDSPHYTSLETTTLTSLDNMGSQHTVQSYSLTNLSNYTAAPTPTTQTHSISDYGNGSGGGSNSSTIPYIDFSWYGGKNRMGLKGGSPFSVVNESPTSHSSNSIQEPSQTTMNTGNIVAEAVNVVQQPIVTPVPHANNVATSNSIHVISSSASTSAGFSEALKELNCGRPRDIEVTSKGTIQFVEPQCTQNSDIQRNINTDYSTPSISFGTNLVTLSTSASGSQHMSVPIKNCTGEPNRIGEKINVIASSNIMSHSQPSIQILGSNVESTMGNYASTSASLMPTVLTSSSADSMKLSFEDQLAPKSSSYVEIPPSSVHQANVNVIGGFRSTKSQDVISHLLDQNRLVPIQTLQSFDTSRLQNIQVGNPIQGNPVSLASFVADAVNAATLPFPQSSNRNVAPGTLVSTSVPLITVYSRPEMRNVSGNPTNLTAVLLTSPRLTTSVAGGQTGSGLVRPTQPQIMGSPLVVTNAHSSSSFTVNKNSGPITSNIAISSKKPSIIAVLPTSSGSSQNQNTAVVYASMGKTSVQSGNICISTPIKVESNVPSGYSTTNASEMGNEFRINTDHQYDDKDDMSNHMKTYIKLEVADDSMKSGDQSQIHRATYMGTPTQIISGSGNVSTASIMQTILAQRMNQAGLQPKIQVSSTPSSYALGNFTQTTTVSPHFTIATTVSPSGESQNALLKQLLQNTGCASMTQAATEPAGFSLTSCLRPTNVPIHTSHLSEEATKIPQPTPVRAQGPIPTNSGITLSAPIRLPFKPETKPLESMSVPHNLPIPIPRIITEDIKPVVIEEPVQPQPPPPPPPPVVIESVKDTISASLKETIDVVASDKTVLDPAIFVDNKKADEEAKKAKRRQYQAKRRQSMGKEPTAPKKRARKGSKHEEDYDSYIENVMTQLRALPPVGIVEPELGKNFNVCALFGAGDYSKLNTKGYNTRKGDLEGFFGSATLSTVSDYYNTKPFGTELPQAVQKPVPTHRGFYNQEFASPKMGSLGDRTNIRSPSPIRDTDTPDTIISTSSPECVMPDNHPYPGLRLIDDEESDQPKNIRDSPVIPMYAPIPIRPIPIEAVKQNDDTDKENMNSLSDSMASKARSGLGSAVPLKETGNNVTVTLTLSSSAAEDIGGILRNLANILSINAPTMYQVVERTITPPSQKFGLYTYKSKDGKEVIDIQSILNGAAKFCRHCDVVVLNNIIKKKASDLPGIHDDSSDGSDDYYFCGTTCFMQFSMTHGIAISSQEKAGSVVNHPSTGNLVQVKSENKSIVLKDCKFSSSKSSIVSQKDNIKVEEISANSAPSVDPKDDSKSKPTGSNETADKGDSEPPTKKWKGIKYKKWTANIPNKAHYKKPTDKEMTEMLFRMGITVTPSKIPDDTRRCMFCHQLGDCLSDGPGRLLNFDVDKWVHLNCALWSEEVYETENGALVNVEVALKQSLVLTCVACRQKGATVKCFKVRCSSVYHLGCALKDGCIFYKNKTVYCSAHVPKGEKENELTTLAVFRRVYIQRDENRQVAAVMHHADQHHLLRVGSLIFLSVGQLLPHQLQAFHTTNYIYPIGYKIVRFYWSMRRINKRCQYICSIHEVEGKPEFRVTAQEEGCKECVIKADSAQAAWLQVLDSISKLRTVSDTIKVFPKFITGEDLFGLTEPAIVKVLESLPGIETLMDYHFKYGRNPLLELPLAINPTGCARAEPKLRTHFKRPHTQRTASAARCSFSSSVISSNSEATCPYSKQFVHSKSSQYKKMKQEWRNNVFLARSKIQGLGLYAARDIEKHTMVIEYIGEIIRSELAELREKKYEASNRGIYMFRVDEDRVIDATLCGGLARYINHSCNPNCVAETVEVDRDLRIIIFANRRISRGEELAYDYKFEFEDDQHKIPCLCGAPNCRQWMN